MNQTTTIEQVTEDEANRRIAELIEPMPTDKPRSLSVGYIQLSPGKQWIARPDTNEWEPMHNYCGNLLDAWPLAARVLLDGTLEQMARWTTMPWHDAMPDLFLLPQNEAAEILSVSFIYAMTGTRLEIIHPDQTGQDGAAGGAGGEL